MEHLQPCEITPESKRPVLAAAQSSTLEHNTRSGSIGSLTMEQSHKIHSHPVGNVMFVRIQSVSSLSS